MTVTFPENETGWTVADPSTWIAPAEVTPASDVGFVGSAMTMISRITEFDPTTRVTASSRSPVPGVIEIVVGVGMGVYL